MQSDKEYKQFICALMREIKRLQGEIEQGKISLQTFCISTHNIVDLQSRLFEMGERVVKSREVFRLKNLLDDALDLRHQYVDADFPNSDDSFVDDDNLLCFFDSEDESDIEELTEILTL